MNRIAFALCMLAIGAPNRLPGLTDLPTVAEGGVPGFEAVSWFALYGPAGMPADIVGKISHAVATLFADAEFERTFLAPQFFESLAGSPAALTEKINAEAKIWSKVIRDANIKVE